MHRAEEDYIKNIYKLTVEKNRKLVKNNEIAELLGFTDQTVNEMIKKLAKKNLLNFIPYKGVHLTKKGLEEAIRLVRYHRLWEVFLVKKLNYEWMDVHAEAEKLEHASSPMLIAYLDKFLGEPKYCVHGNVIPTLDGDFEVIKDMPLSDAKKDDIFILERVMDQPQLLTFLDDKHIKLHDQFKVIETDSFNAMISIKHQGQVIDLSMVVANKLFGRIK